MSSELGLLIFISGETLIWYFTEQQKYVEMMKIGGLSQPRLSGKLWTSIPPLYLYLGREPIPDQQSHDAIQQSQQDHKRTFNLLPRRKATTAGFLDGLHWCIVHQAGCSCLSCLLDHFKMFYIHTRSTISNGSYPSHLNSYNDLEKNNSHVLRSTIR